MVFCRPAYKSRGCEQQKWTRADEQEDVALHKCAMKTIACKGENWERQG